jgi:hypothetical protein
MNVQPGIPATRPTATYDRTARAHFALAFGTGGALLFFVVGWLASGLDWYLIRISVGLGAFTAAFMWTVLHPKIYPVFLRPLGRFGFLLVMAGAVQLFVAGHADVVAFAPFIVLMMLSALALTDFWRRWIVWKPFPAQSVADVFVSTVGALLILTLALSYLTAMLHAHGVVMAKRGIQGDAFVAFEGYYGWHLLDLVPVLKLPSTLNLPHPVNVTDIWAGGILLLLYKALVALPVIGVATQLFSQRTPNDDGRNR